LFGEGVDVLVNVGLGATGTDQAVGLDGGEQSVGLLFRCDQGGESVLWGHAVASCTNDGTIIADRGGSAKGEGEGLHAGVEELDSKGVVGDGTFLADELIEPLAVHNALTVGVDIRAMAVGRRFAVNGDAEVDWAVAWRGTEHEMQVASVEAIDD
jgi:hypothetical protein